MGMLEQIGVSGSKLVEAMLRTPLPAKAKKLVRQSSKIGFAQMLLSVPEPSKEDKAKALAVIEELRKMPQQMRPLLRNAAKELPRGRSGPRKKLSIEKEIMACAGMNALRVEYSDRVAIQRTAQKYGISERTMYRIWKKHRSHRKTSSSEK